MEDLITPIISYEIIEASKETIDFFSQYLKIQKLKCKLIDLL